MFCLKTLDSAKSREIFSFLSPFPIFFLLSPPFLSQSSQLGSDCKISLASAAGGFSISSIFYVLFMLFWVHTLVWSSGFSLVVFTHRSILKGFVVLFWVCFEHIQLRGESKICMSSRTELENLLFSAAFSMISPHSLACSLRAPHAVVWFHMNGATFAAKSWKKKKK